MGQNSLAVSKGEEQSQLPTDWEDLWQGVLK